MEKSAPALGLCELPRFTNSEIKVTSIYTYNIHLVFKITIESAVNKLIRFIPELLRYNWSMKNLHIINIHNVVSLDVYMHSCYHHQIKVTNISVTSESFHVFLLFLKVFKLRIWIQFQVVLSQAHIYSIIKNFNLSLKMNSPIFPSRKCY